MKILYLGLAQDCLQAMVRQTLFPWNSSVNEWPKREYRVREQGPKRFLHKLIEGA